MQVGSNCTRVAVTLLGSSDGDGGASDGDGTSAVVDRPRRAGSIWKVFAEGVGSFSELSGAALT